MKVFLSWSGSSSNEVAQALRRWLPAVLQATRPYFSPDDIAKGARWSSEVAMELQESKVGILCVTKENLSAPWLMFEAGALAKSLDRSRVIPLLVGVEPADLSGPLAQFQASRFDRKDMLRTMSVINEQLGSAALDEGVLSSVFDKWWPDLEATIGAIATTSKHGRGSSARTDRELLEEILVLMRDRTFRHFQLPVFVGTPIEKLDLMVRSTNCLKAEDIHTIEELIDRSEEDLLKIPNLGRKAVNEIKDALASFGMKLKMHHHASGDG